MLQERQFSRAEWALSAIRDDVVRVSRGRPMHWVTINDIARRLGLDLDVVEAAVRGAIERGWFVGDGSVSPHSVRLSISSTQQLEPVQE